MTQEQIDQIIHDFGKKFNTMCANERRDFLIREWTSTDYETGITSTYRKPVTYKVKKKRNKWRIRAETKGFWIFKRRFPLFDIIHSNGTIEFKGLYTHTIPVFEEALLAEKLDEYIAICKRLPPDAFVRS